MTMLTGIRPALVTRNLSTWIAKPFRKRASAHGGFLAIPAFLAHGVGGARYDELFIFGGIGLVVGTLVFMSWRAGKDRKKRRARRRSKR